MSRALVGLALVLTVGCSSTAEPAAPARTAAAADRPVEASAAPTGFQVRLEPSETPTSGPDGGALVAWETAWTLTWEPSADAEEYGVWFGTNEGAGDEPRRSVAAPELRLTAATGTSPPARLEQDRRAGLLFTSSQLLVSVAARTADGTYGERSPWFPVGDAPADGRPIGTAAPGHDASS